MSMLMMRQCTLLHLCTEIVVEATKVGDGDLGSVEGGCSVGHVRNR